MSLLLAMALPSAFAGPNTAFTDDLWEIGDISVDKAYEKDISIANPGDAPIAIDKIRTSCPCIKIQKISDTAQPGEAIRLRVVFNSFSGLSGDLDYFVWISVNGAENKTHKLTIKAHVKEEFAIPDEAKLEDNSIVIFYSPAYSDRARLASLLEYMKNKRGTKISQYDISKKNYPLLAVYEKAYTIDSGGLIQAFVKLPDNAPRNDKIDCYKSPDALIARLEGILKPETQDGLEISIFYTPGCMECSEVLAKIVPEIQMKYSGQVSFRKYDYSIESNYLKLIDLENRYGVTEDEPVIVFVGDKTYLAGKEAIHSGIDAAISTALKAPKTTAISSEPQDPAVLVERFNSFGLWGIIAAGLIDGINPCAFATIIFLISFMAFIGKTRKEIVVIGLFYTATVFITYLLLGIGVFKVLQQIEAYSTVRRVMNSALLALVIFLAIMTAYDIYAYLRSRRTKDISLQLPQKLKERIHKVVRENLRTRGLILSATIIGFFVTLFESVCTGQVYIPTLAFVLKMPELRGNALFYLILYNLMFILPLMVVFAVSIAGTGSGRLEAMTKKNVLIMKLMALAFLILVAVILLTQ